MARGSERLEAAPGFTPDERAGQLLGIAIILSALLVSFSMFFVSGGIAAAIASQVSRPCACGDDALEAGGVPAIETEVTMDFLYSDACVHCQRMKPYVAALEKELPQDRFAVRYWSEDDYRAGGQAAEVYGTYEAMGFFPGYPTFVINGDDYRAGEMPEAQFREWVCSKFSAPKPQAC